MSGNLADSRKARSLPEHLLERANACIWIACPGLGARNLRSLVWAPSGTRSGHNCCQFPLLCTENTQSLSHSPDLEAN